MNQITRKLAKELNINFNDIISDIEEYSYQEHRRGATFFTKGIIEIDEEFFPNVPRELDGFWETNTYVHSDDHGFDKDEIDTLTRVEKKVNIIEKIVWEKVK